jgi:hypothetical protein
MKTRPNTSDRAIRTDFEDPSTAADRASDATTLFSTIRADYGPQNALVTGLDTVRMKAVKLRAERVAKRLPLPMPVVATIAELGVGKTIGAETLAALRNPTDPADRRRPVLLATIDGSGLQISVPQAILKALGKPNWSHATKPAQAWERALKALRDHEVEIVIFDEINRAARRPTMAAAIGTDIMDMLVTAEVAVAFLGTKEADTMFNRVPALKDRLKAPVVMKALDWCDDGQGGEREVFIDFLDAMDGQMMALGLIRNKAGLAERKTADMLWQVCRGRLRPLCELLEEAVYLIHLTNGELVLTNEILAQACENHSIENGHVSYNPFNGETPE